MLISDQDRLMKALREYFAAVDRWQLRGVFSQSDALYLDMIQRRDDVRMIFTEIDNRR